MGKKQGQGLQKICRSYREKKEGKAVGGGLIGRER